jgi:hypothetical protein
VNEIAGNVARMLGSELSTVFWWGDQNERDHLEDQGVDDVIVLK